MDQVRPTLVKKRCNARGQLHHRLRSYHRQICFYRRGSSRNKRCAGSRSYDRQSGQKNRMGLYMR
jgi:hypothetical protein